MHHLGGVVHEIHIEIGFDRVNALERMLGLLDTVEAALGSIPGTPPYLSMG